MRDLQYIVILCVVIIVVVAGGFFIASLGAQHSQMHLNQSSVDHGALPDPSVPKPLNPPDLPINTPDVTPSITSFDECVAAGNPVMESYPRQCRAGDHTFVEEIEIEEPVACTMDAKQCPDGSYVGRVGPDCEFAACPAEEPYAEAVVCTDEQKQAEFCTMEYAPVCGLVDVQCFTTPCDPVPETFGNGCSACAQGNVISYTEGACE